MKFKRAVSAAAAGIMLIGATAYAKDNIYAYNKFVSTVLGPQVGYCDFAASFTGREGDYANVNDFFTGLISAFYDDIDADYDNELITVDSKSVTVYQVEENGVVFLGSADHELIANYGDSYANVFTVPVGLKKYVGIERYGKTANMYDMNVYELNPDTDELSEVIDIHREDNEDGVEEKIWAGGKTYYSKTVGGGMTTTMNPDGYDDLTAAVMQAFADVIPEAGIDGDAMKARMTGSADESRYKLTASGINVKTYVRATGLRFTDKPVVMFEDNSELEELKTVPDIVTVTIDGNALRFPLQDPIIVDGRTLVPMRTIFEALGAQVQWIDENGVKTVIATTADKTINMTIDSDKFYVNGEEKTLDVPAQLINDKTLVPIRAVSESLGCIVDWVDESKTVIIKTSVPETEQDNTAPEQENTVPESDNTVPEQENTVPETDNTVPEEENTAPETENTVPDNGDAAPETE